ncbi:MAG: DUF2085 domain-containing protein, partial [Methanobacterium sp.]|nr:DUF2085 domain-containing protein [Methanobacterium sp.]
MSFFKLLRNKLRQGNLICHGIPERSFKIKGHMLPVCARCTGLYLGSFSYILLLVTFNWGFSLPVFITGIILIIPTFTDGITQICGVRTSNNTLRFLSG